MEAHQNATGYGDALLYDYDVFLSFRGPDTRSGFTDFLYKHLTQAAGLRVFRDDDELNLGDEINRILQEIDNSRLCIPVFSKTFAESKWCLWEVTRMVERRKHILPIFYDVTVDDVKLETPVYKEFMPQHVTKSGEEEVEKWKEALKTIAACEGKQVSTLALDDTAFFESFVKEILIKLKYKRIFDIDAPIGLEDQARDAIQLLDIDSSGVRYFGIYGMGGIGKTTLAKDIFNQIKDQFDGSCFLEDIRESFRRHDTTFLMKKLLNSLNSPTPRGETDEDLSRLMEESFLRKKILIVLDDVDQWEQIGRLAGKSNWFGSGSRIIVTSRDRSVLETGKGKLREEEVRNIEMEPLGNDHALQLFNRHAFQEGIPSAGFEDLTEKAVALMGGLPLALKIIGSSLKERKRGVWEEVIEKLKKIPYSDVKERLRISYDSLEREQQQIFLDIACFFVGSSVTKPIYMWKATQFCPNSGLEILSFRSLVKVSDEGKISMHDQLRDLGRDIVCEENFKLPAYRSRLWEDETARKVLMRKKDKPNVEALRIEGDFAIDVTQQEKEIGRLKNLRYLHLQQTNLQGKFGDIFPDLIWLSYHSHINSQATIFAVTSKLVILDFSCSTIDEHWCGWSQLENAKNLKVLDLSEAKHLRRTPYFHEGMAIERLILNGCSELVAIDGSIRHLNRLKFLSLERCNSLTGLPEEVGSLEHLEYIVLGHSLNSHLKKFENLTLQEGSSTMDISDGDSSKNPTFLRYKICGLPISFGKLGELKFLSLSDLPITELPESFGELKSLLILDLDGTEISTLPDSIKGFEKLKKLSLRQCQKLKSLPHTLGALNSLVALYLMNAGLVELPSSIGKLANLKLLSLSYCTNMKKLPNSLGNITSLVHLHLHATRVLELPESIGKLRNLENLSLSGTGITKLPESIGGLENLREIYLDRCQLKMLPKSFGALKKLEKLYAQYADLSEGLPSEISGLSSLKLLNLSRTKVCELPSSINKLHSLRYLILEECNQLQELPELPADLVELRVSSKELHTVHLLSNLQSLTRLVLASPLASSDSVFGIWKLTQLVELQLIVRTTFPDEFGNLSRLKSLWLSCSSLTSIPRLPLSLEKMYLMNVRRDLHLPNLPDLMNLSILNVTTVLGIGPIRFSLPESLRELYVTNSSDLESWPDISHLKNLRILHVLDCPSLTEISGLGKLKSLEYLVIERCHSLTRLENLSQLKQIESVCIGTCRKLVYPEGVDSSKVRGNFQEMSETITNEQYDICSLLSSPRRDFLIRGDDRQVKVDYLKGKKVCLYFHQPSWGTFTSLLFCAREFLNKGSNVEWMVVCVPCHNDEYDLKRTLVFENWLAVPISDEDTCTRLYMQFQEHYDHDDVPPKLVIFNETGRVLTTEGFEIIGSCDSLTYPLTPESIQSLKRVNEHFRMNEVFRFNFLVRMLKHVLTLDEDELPISELKGKIVGIYFSESPHEEPTTLTREMRDVYKELKANGESFEIVWAPIKYRQNKYYEIFSRLPQEKAMRWLLICFRLYFYFNVSSLPTLLILNEDGKILQPNAAKAIEIYGAKAYPFTPEKIAKVEEEECHERVKAECKILQVSIHHEFLITNTGERVDASTLARKNILLYLSCRSSDCCDFMPKLLEAYNEIKSRDDAFEVIFVSNDEDEASFLECFSTMSWFALPYGDERIEALYSELEVTQTPTLVAIGPTDRIITKDVRDLIIAYGSGAYPFTHEHISNMVKSWPHKLQHAKLHAHELTLIGRRYYICDGCNYQIPVQAWSYCCKKCDFDLHPQCAFEGDKWESLEELETRSESTSYPFTPEMIEKARQERERVKEECERLVVSFSREFLNTNRGDSADASTLVGKNIVLYFSRQISVCCALRPKLLEVYNEIKERGDAFEVITMSLDENEASFHQSCSAMPWLSLPFGDVRIHILYYMLEVTRVPTLVAIGLTDRIIRKDVGDLIVAYGSDAYPFTHEHISNTIKSWPPELQHPLHAQHELTLIERRYYICDLCNYQLPAHAWSYCCISCNFHLHPKCAFKGGKSESPEEHGTRILSQGECSQSSSRMVFEEGN